MMVGIGSCVLELVEILNSVAIAVSVLEITGSNLPIAVVPLYLARLGLRERETLGRAGQRMMDSDHGPSPDSLKCKPSRSFKNRMLRCDEIRPHKWEG